MLDFHMHSRYSNDGELTPRELVLKCANSDIRIMSITDHNTVAATFEAINSAAQQNIKYLPGIEIDCTFENTNFHVLGYQINFEDDAYREIESNIRSQALLTSHTRLEKIRKLGFLVTQEDLDARAKNSYWPESWTGEMFAEIILNLPEYLNNPLLQPYRQGGARSDNPLANFYWDFFAQGKPCFAKSNFPSMQKIIDIIHQTHGYAVLAHPCVNLKGNTSLLHEIVKLGIDGIEAFSSYHNKEQADKILQFVNRYNLFTTCGSDFHGKIKPAINLGDHHCPFSDAKMQKHLQKMLSKVLS